ncbi:MAG TPA: radical SAM protein [Candidatus Limnocylindria bacterium]|nr:radical SAM protein [Candidatus Limnocylindria bacterium]
MRSRYVEEPCKSALNRVTGMDFKWSLNPYTGCGHRCTFCYVRTFERRADRPADDRYGESVRIKVNVAEILQQELQRPSWQREMVAIGAATDPYQPAEGRYRLTRSCLEVFAAHRNPISIITRGPMIIRDLDVLQDAARRAEVSVSFSIPTLDHDIWRRTEPSTAPPRQRLRALSALVAAGVRAGVGMAPILPGLSDDPKKMADVVRAVRDAGATFLWVGTLYLKPGTREHFLAHLVEHWPNHLPLYEQLYAGRAYLAPATAQPIRDQFATLKRRFPLRQPATPLLAPPPEAEQIELTL